MGREMDRPRHAANPPLCQVMLEVNSCAEEHVPGRICAARLTKRGVLQFCIYGSQVDSVEEVEGIKTKLDVEALRDACSFFQRKVGVCVTWIQETVGSLVAFRPKGWQREITAG